MGQLPRDAEKEVKMTEELLKYIIIQLYFVIGFLLMNLVMSFRKKV